MRQTILATAEAATRTGENAAAVLLAEKRSAPPRAASMEELAHDARNLMTALGLYCDLLEEPGVLSASHLHYAPELRLVAQASRSLVEKMASEVQSFPGLPQPGAAHAKTRREPFGRRAKMRECITDLSQEVTASRHLLSAVAGPGIVLDVQTSGGAGAVVNLDVEDLTRVLVNLVKNASETMPVSGRIEIRLVDQEELPGTVPSVLLTVEDNGPGLPAEVRERVFEAGVTSRLDSCLESRPSTRRRGLGLAIVRSIVESAGGRVDVSTGQMGGACFRMEIPVAAR